MKTSISLSRHEIPFCQSGPFQGFGAGLSSGFDFSLWYNIDYMAEKFDIEAFSRIVLDEFSRVNERLDQIGHNFDNRLLDLGSELRSIHRELDTLTQAVGNMAGFSKEIDHLLQRVAAIEKHLGLTSSITA